MKCAHLFAGINGFGLASEWVGWHNIMHCEIDNFCQQVIKYYWPNSIIHGDIKTTDFTGYRGKIDLLTGGFPCQPFSVAGKQQGTADDRHLWPEMLRAIQEIRPSWVVGENVPGFVGWSGGLVFEQVCTDLESKGYEVQPFIIPACAVNAPHRRDRVWIIAHANGHDARRSGYGQTGSETREDKENKREWERIRYNLERDVKKGTYSNASVKRCEEHNITKKPDELGFGGGVCNKRNSSNSDSKHVHNRGLCSSGVQFQGSAGILENIPGFGSFPSVSPVCFRDDGISFGLPDKAFSGWIRESIKALGNAIVPQVAYEIFKAIQENENTNHILRRQTEPFKKDNSHDPRA